MAEQKTRNKIKSAIGKMEAQFYFLYKMDDFSVSLVWVNISEMKNSPTHTEYLAVWKKGYDSQKGKRGLTEIYKIHRDVSTYIFETLLFDGEKHFKDFGNNPVIANLQYTQDISIITPSQPRVITKILAQDDFKGEVIEWDQGVFYKLLPKEIFK